MRLPTLQVVDGVIDEISSHGDSFKLVGAGHAQPLPGNLLLDKEAIGYLGDCVYRTDNAALNLNPASWSLQLYAHIPSIATIIATHDIGVTMGGWSIALSSRGLYLYTTAFNGVNHYTELATYLEFPEGLNLNKPKHYALVKEVNHVKVYVDYQLATQFNLPSKVGTPGFSIFGTTGGKPSYNTASTLYCNFIKFDHKYVSPVDEFTTFTADVAREVALSLFDPANVNSLAFDRNHLKGVRNFSPPLTDIDFVGAIGLLPPLTADVGAVYAVAASDVYSASYPAWKAFPGINYVPTSSELWASNAAPGDKWLSIRRLDNKPFLVNAFRITDGTIDGYRGIDYILQGKMHEDTKWTDLYKATNVPVTPDLSHYFTNIGTHNYSEYRVLFTKYALENKRMAVSLFQLYYVEGYAGSKSFGFSNDTKEIAIVTKDDRPGNFIKSLTFGGDTYPRSFTLVLNDNSTLLAGQQEIVEDGLSYPWGNGSGYVAKDNSDNYYTKQMTFEGFNIQDINGERVFTYNALSGANYSIDGLDTYVHTVAPGGSFLSTPANTWMTVPLESKQVDSSVALSGTVRKLQAGTYIVRGFVTLQAPNGAVAVLSSSDGVTLLQSLGAFAGGLTESTIQVTFMGTIELYEPTDILLKVHTTSASKTTESLTSKVLVKAETTKLNFFKV